MLNNFIVYFVKDVKAKAQLQDGRRIGAGAKERDMAKGQLSGEAARHVP